QPGPEKLERLQSVVQVFSSAPGQSGPAQKSTEEQLRTSVFDVVVTAGPVQGQCVLEVGGGLVPGGQQALAAGGQGQCFRSGHGLGPTAVSGQGSGRPFG